MGLFSSLNREQKEALGLLQIGTFLEYFDLMLYIHMVVLLNELFFPKTDPHTAALLAAFAFCSTFIFRPIGALIFGWIGDHIGRKSTIIITTIMMSISCIVMANLPTYEQIGIASAWIITLCRMAQGMSSMGEIMGAKIYLAESILRPASYPAVAFITVATDVGTMVALGVATLCSIFLLNWRLAFWIGAVIALVGAVARTRLRETPEFLEMKRQQMEKDLAEVNNYLEEDNGEAKSSKQTNARKEPVEIKTLMACFFIYCGWPLFLYLAFIYFNPVLKESFGYSPEDIIKHNFFLSIVSMISSIFVTLLSYYIHPIRILKTIWIFTFFVMITLPLLIINLDTPFQLFLIQVLLLLFPLQGIPAEAIFMYHFPISRRFTYASFLHAVARALMYIITSFGLVYLGNYFGPFGLWLITLPVTFAFLYGVLHFEELERKLGMFRPNNLFYKTDLLKKRWFKT